MFDFKKLVVRYLREAADRIEVGNSELSETEAMDIMKVIAHKSMSKEQACQYLNMSTSRFDDRESMVYSALIYQSLDNPEYFNRDSGKFDISRVKSFIANALTETGKECIEYDEGKVNKSEISKQTGIARSTVCDICNRFVESKIIEGSTIQCPLELLDEHYFELPKLSQGVKLTFQQRLFYGFLKNRARNYGGIIDTKEYILARLFGKNKEAIKTLLAVLKRNHLTERLPDGRLKIK